MVFRAAARVGTKSGSGLLTQRASTFLGSRQEELLAKARTAQGNRHQITLAGSWNHSNSSHRNDVVFGNFNFRRGRTCLSGDGGAETGVQAEIESFDRDLPVEEARTPPSSWYTSSQIFDRELQNIFERRWLPVAIVLLLPRNPSFGSSGSSGRTEHLQTPGDYFTGKIGRIRYVVCLDDERNVRAFHNVCRHHAAAVAGGSGCTTSFVCPYHGWTYGLDGKLQKATRLGGIKNFSARENGLLPLRASTWGPFVLISSLSEDVNGDDDWHASMAENEWLGDAAEPLANAKIDSSLKHVRTREYTLNCNWKVYSDNYLDGGYHVPYAHRGLASDLNLKSYEISLFDKVSIQSCQGSKSSSGDVSERVGSSAVYAYIYPNFIINRYGPWMDTNLVVPLTPDSCRVVFDYYLDSSYADNNAFIDESIRSSDSVQQEDIALCEAVQDGLQSPAYDVGRYAPKVEHAMHHFHCLLHDDLAQRSKNTCNGVDRRRLQVG